jgi:hypothetical protein
VRACRDTRKHSSAIAIAIAITAIKMKIIRIIISQFYPHHVFHPQDLADVE